MTKMTKELQAQISELRHDDIQQVLELITKDKVVFSYWVWSDIKTVIDQYEMKPITPFTEDQITKICNHLQDVDNYSVLMEDMWDAIVSACDVLNIELVDVN